MKIASFNVKGLSDPSKFRLLWSWLLTLDLDIVCLQEHKLHQNAGSIQYCKGYSLIYGGKSGEYSGSLTVVKSILNPVVVFNHESGRGLAVSVQSSFGLLTICNIYGSNQSSIRANL